MKVARSTEEKRESLTEAEKILTTPDNTVGKKKGGRARLVKN